MYLAVSYHSIKSNFWEHIYKWYVTNVYMTLECFLFNIAT